jgi:AraC-like DNA-binding protein
MNWFEMINDATDYIEKHLTSDIDLHDIAHHCHVSYSYFAKVFPMITGYSLKEYIRNRRMTMASYEVSNTTNRIIDIAMKYGYGSNEAFSRAFKMIHGMNPSVARKNDYHAFMHFPVIHYDIPNQELSDLSYDILEETTFSFIGRTIHITENRDIYEIRKELDAFRDAFCKEVGYINHTSGEHNIYKIKYNIHTEDPISYDCLFGFDATKVQLENSYDTIQISHNRFVRYSAVGLGYDTVRLLKTTIIDEWLDIGFEYEPVCEIEHVKEREDHSYELTYIVSIK